jgi:hypothetical protein
MVQLIFLRTWIRTGPGSPLLCHVLRSSTFKTCDPGSRWSFWGPGLGQAPVALLLRRALRISIFKTWDPGCPDARWCFWGPRVLPLTSAQRALCCSGDGALSMILVFLFLFCVSPIFPSRNDVSSCSLQKFLVSEKKIIPFFSRGTGVQVSLQVPVWGLLKNRSVLCQGLQKDVLIDWWRMSCSCTILFSFLYSERDLEIEMQVEPWERLWGHRMALKGENNGKEGTKTWTRKPGGAKPFSVF